MNGSVFAASLLLLAGCSSPEASRFHVAYRGALKTIMHDGDISAKADLNEFQENEHLYALGALEDLKGEILILDGEPSVSTVEASQIRIDHSFRHGAALFVYASVHRWRSFEIPDAVITNGSLEQFIAATAASNDIAADEPFPFLLEGRADTVQWHVIDWPEGDPVHTHEKHKASGLHGVETGMTVTALGFYSEHHHAIFTHYSTNMHLHGMTDDGRIAGHLDRLIPGTGMILKLPAS